MEIKTLGQLLQDILEEEEMYYSLHDFLIYSTDEQRKEIEKKLTEKESEQFKEYMDGFSFIDKNEVYSAACDYYEKVMNRAISMGECSDMSELSDDYIKENGLNFDD